MNKGISVFTMVISLATVACTGGSGEYASSEKNFLHVDGHNIVDSKGDTFYIKGTNLGNWLNPEGYMFGFATIRTPSTICEPSTSDFVRFLTLSARNSST